MKYLHNQSPLRVSFLDKIYRKKQCPATFILRLLCRTVYAWALFKILITLMFDTISLSQRFFHWNISHTTRPNTQCLHNMIGGLVLLRLSHRHHFHIHLCLVLCSPVHRVRGSVYVDVRESCVVNTGNSSSCLVSLSLLLFLLWWGVHGDVCLNGVHLILRWIRITGLWLSTDLYSLDLGSDGLGQS